MFKQVGLPPQIPGMAVRGSLPIMVGNVQVGYASTSTWSPLLKKYIALAHLQKPYFEVGTDVQNGNHGRTSPSTRACEGGQAAVL